MTDSTSKKLHIVLVNGIVVKGKRVLIAQRSLDEIHEPGKWTIPGGKVEKTAGNQWNILEKTLKREVFEETGIKIKDKVQLITNNTFIRSTGHHVVSLVFLCYYQSGKAKPLEDTVKVKWISPQEINRFHFAPNVRNYLSKGFNFLNKSVLKLKV